MADQRAPEEEGKFKAWLRSEATKKILAVTQQDTDAARAAPPIPGYPRNLLQLTIALDERTTFKFDVDPDGLDPGIVVNEEFLERAYSSYKSSRNKRRRRTRLARSHEELLAKLRAAIAALPDGATPEGVIAEAGVNNQKGRNALRELQKRGEYASFTRDTPDRYTTQ